MSSQYASAVKHRTRKCRADTITMAHGSGGKAMRDLIEDVFVSVFDSPELNLLEDQAKVEMSLLQSKGSQLAMTTDSYVVDPLFFPGGDIGKLAVTGTVNDLAVGGAIPLYLTCGVIIEEGMSVAELRRITRSMKQSADEAGVKIITGDTKVVPRGVADKMFVNTAGIGIVPNGVDLGSHRINAGDTIIINGFVGDHGAAIVDARGEMSLQNTIETDCQPLNGLIQAMLRECPNIHCMRDATRGGVATVMCEFAEESKTSIRLDECALPLREEVRGMCEILGLDPLYLANEGKVVAVVPAKDADSVLAVMRAHPSGEQAAIIGRVYESPRSNVILSTAFGGERLVDMLVGEQLPRIC